MRTVARQLWAPDDLIAAHDAWQTGWGDLPFAAVRRTVPPIVQLGVLAHADWRRLDDLRSAGRASRASRTWGSAALQLVDQVLRGAQSPEKLMQLQAAELRPLERLLLNRGEMDLSAPQLLDLVGRALSPGGGANASSCPRFVDHFPPRRTRARWRGC